MPLSVLLLLALSTQPAAPAAPAAPETAPSAEPTVAPADAVTAATDEQFARGIEALKAQDVKSAIAALSACVEAAPARVDCRWELGWAYSLENKWAEALAQWLEVQKLKPD